MDDAGRALEGQGDGVGIVHFHEFEKTVPSAQLLYLYQREKGASIKHLEGELLITQGRLIVAEFDGTQRQTKRVQNESFSVESVKTGSNGIEIVIASPLTKVAASARSPQERLQAMMSDRGTYAAEIEDSKGQLHISTSGSSSAGGGSSSFGFSKSGTRRGSTDLQQQQTVNTKSFSFESLPDGRSIKTIRVRMIERTGATKSVPFQMEDIPLP